MFLFKRLAAQESAPAAPKTFEYENAPLCRSRCREVLSCLGSICAPTHHAVHGTQTDHLDLQGMCA